MGGLGFGVSFGVGVFFCGIYASVVLTFYFVKYLVVLMCVVVVGLCCCFLGDGLWVILYKLKKRFYF